MVSTVVVKSSTQATTTNTLAATVRIAVDAMGGDHGPSVTVPAALSSLAAHPELELVLLGQEAPILAELQRHSRTPDSRLSIIHCDEVIGMADKPSQALRSKKQSSMRIGVEKLKAGEVDGMVSAGNTGALMAIGYYVLKTSPGIDRPAICVAMPTQDSHAYLLDLGANVDNCSEHLAQFALMGSVLAQVLDNNECPKVALLNIGEEDIKGNEQVKLADSLMADDQRINYVGYLEADRLLAGSADVVVCDGFVGNVALKSAEGAARLIAYKGERAFRKNVFTRMLGALARPVVKKVQKEIDPELYNGAFFLGLQGVLVKSHGHATATGFSCAIDKALAAVNNRMVERLDQNLEHLAL